MMVDRFSHRHGVGSGWTRVPALALPVVEVTKRTWLPEQMVHAALDPSL
jgi:hypothetical protein